MGGGDSSSAVSSASGLWRVFDNMLGGSLLYSLEALFGGPHVHVQGSVAEVLPHAVWMGALAGLLLTLPGVILYMFIPQLGKLGVAVRSRHVRDLLGNLGAVVFGSAFYGLVALFFMFSREPYPHDYWRYIRLEDVFRFFLTGYPLTLVYLLPLCLIGQSARLAAEGAVSLFKRLVVQPRPPEAPR